MTYEQFIKIIGKYIDLSLYDIRFKKSPYYKNENEMWLYKKDDEGELKRVITGYYFNGKRYDSLKEMRKDFTSGRNDYTKIFSFRKRRMGLLIKEENLLDEEYLNIALNG